MSNKVGRWVSSHSERPDLPWTFIVIDVEPANAFAAPGGYVVVTTGLLKRLNSEAELAGVLGHEVSRGSKHHLSAIKKADTTAFLRMQENLISTRPVKRPARINSYWNFST